MQCHLVLSAPTNWVTYGLATDHLQSQFNAIKDNKLFQQRKLVKYLLACATMFVCLLSIAAAVSDKVTITSSANWRCMLLRLASAHNYNQEEQMVNTEISGQKEWLKKNPSFTFRLSCNVGSKCGRKYLGTESAISTRDFRTESSFW